MVERHASALIAGVIVFLVTAVLWHAFVRPVARAPRAGRPAVASTSVVIRSETTAVGRPTPPFGDTARLRGGAAASPAWGATAFGAPAPPAPPAAARSGPSYMELLARSETRRRIRASAGYTYLNEVVAAGRDSMLHRWDNRIFSPVRVLLAPGRAANFQPAFLDAVRAAFERWQTAGVPVRWNLDADSASAEVRVVWRIQFDIRRTGQTDLTWDQEGHLASAVVSLATFDPDGHPLTADDVRVVALHEIGHLIGLDHSADSTDIMFATTRVRDLSTRDVASALLLYQLPPGTLK
jgi:predicted Zn-dependent protease